MDNHKLMWHPDRVNAWSIGDKIAPLHIDLGITTGCNIACIYCYGFLQGRSGVNKRFDMPKEALLRLLNDSKEVGVRSISFIGEGENTLNNALYDGLDFAREIQLDVGLGTNGITLKRDKIPNILTALSWLRFNISAATSESYFRIHHSKDFNMVIQNIECCVKTKSRYKLGTTIGLQMVIMRENAGDIISLAKLGCDLGVDYLVIKPCSDDPDRTLNAPNREYQEMKELFHKAENYTTNNYNVIIKWNKLSNAGLKDFEYCYGTRFIIAISGNGNVFPCGHFFNIRTDEFLMGNIIETPLSKIIQSERYWEVQGKISTLDVNKECETNCRQYYINQFLWKFKNPPPHVNFI